MIVRVQEGRGVTHHPEPVDRRHESRAADDIAAFAALFEARLAADAAGDERDRAEAHRMDLLVHTVQRHLEHIGRAWLEDAGDGRRPEALVALLAYGAANDVAPVAGRALAQLRAAELQYRSGDVDPPPLAPRHRRRQHGRARRSGRWVRVGALVVAALTLWVIALSALGSWGVTEDPLPLTASERTF